MRRARLEAAILDLWEHKASHRNVPPELLQGMSEWLETRHGGKMPRAALAEMLRREFGVAVSEVAS